MVTSILRGKVAGLGMALLAMLLSLASGCAAGVPSSTARTVPHEGDWGVYELDLATIETRLVYSSRSEIQTSAVRLNRARDRLLFAQKVDGDSDADFEIFSIGVDGSGLTRLTNNKFWDLYPACSPDGQQIAFLSKREKDLDIYVMEADGANARKLFDSGFHDGDVDWAADSIVFTSQFAIWRINAVGAEAARVTNPPGRGEWGKANLPKGDYDPRLSHDGRKVVFERLEDASTANGGYNLFAVNVDGQGETRLTDNGYSQGLASWSSSGDKIVYVVAAISGEGRYDIHMMNSDGTNNRDITPSYFPPTLLCHSPAFSRDDSKLFFIGQWWK